MTDEAGPAPIRGHQRRPLLIALAIIILLLAAAARFHRLGAQSLWYDEGVAYAHSTRTLPDLISHLQTNVHVPAYFTLLGWWRDLAGSSEFALRMPSALFSIISVAFAYGLGARLFHPVAGLAAAALVAFNSFSIYYAQEARMYAMLTAIAASSMWLWLDILREREAGAGEKSGWGRVIALGLINALGLYTHFAQAFVILTQAALVTLGCCASLIRDRPARQSTPLPWRRWLKVPLAHALTLMLFLPWLPVAIAQLGSRSHRLQRLPIDQMLHELIEHLAFGSAFDLSASNLWLVACVFLLLGLFPPARRWRDRWIALLPVAWALISIAVFLFVGLGQGFLRFLLPAQLACALWLGGGIWVLWQLPIRQGPSYLSALPKLVSALALAIYLLALIRGLAPLYHHPAFQRDDMRGLARQIESDLRPGDAVIVSAPGLQELLRYYYRGDAPVYPLPLGGDIEATRNQARDIIAAHDRLQVIFYGAEQQDPNLVVETTFNRDAFEVDDRWVDDLRYVLYVSPADMSEPTVLARDFADEILLHAVALSTTTLAPGDVLQVQLVWTALAAPSGRYKAFLQLLNGEGVLVAQRDSEPVGGSSRTTAWSPGESIADNHGLLIPANLTAGEYRLIAGLYDINDPSARLPVGDSSYVELGTIVVGGAS